jgi:hypothetical protein
MQTEQRGLFDQPEVHHNRLASWPPSPRDSGPAAVLRDLEAAAEAVRTTWTGTIEDPSPALTERFRLATQNWRAGHAALNPSNAWGVWSDGKR